MHSRRELGKAGPNKEHSGETGLQEVHDREEEEEEKHSPRCQGSQGQR